MLKAASKFVIMLLVVTCLSAKMRSSHRVALLHHDVFLVLDSLWDTLLSEPSTTISALSVSCVSSLVMVPDAKTLYQKAGWPGVAGGARGMLMDKLQSMCVYYMHVCFVCPPL